MKRKTIVIVGLTGTLLAGTALTGFMVNAYLGSQRMSLSSDIRSGERRVVIDRTAPRPVVDDKDARVRTSTPRTLPSQRAKGEEAKAPAADLVSSIWKISDLLPE